MVSALGLTAAALNAGQPAGVNDAAVTAATFPATLAEFGFFADPRAQAPAPRVVPYRLNTPLWSDGADKLRFLYLPAGARAQAEGEGLLALPVGAALIKTFAFHEAGKRRLIETRVLLHRVEGWVALPYVWNEAQSEARLALAGGRVAVTTPAGESISYAVPNKNQCKECHGVNGAVSPIGPRARNLSPDWLAAENGAGRLDRVPEVADRVPLWEARAQASAQAAARGYLDVNCAHCHNPEGSAANAGLDLRWEQADPVKLGVGKRPVAAGRGAGDLAFDVAPGDPDRSIMVHRMRSLEPGVAMPELGRATVDPQGVATVRRWIAAMPKG